MHTIMFGYLKHPEKTIKKEEKLLDTIKNY